MHRIITINDIDMMKKLLKEDLMHTENGVISEDEIEPVELDLDWVSWQLNSMMEPADAWKRMYYLINDCKYIKLKTKGE